MKIAYHGCILEEGLIKFGAELYPFDLDKDLTLCECVENAIKRYSFKPDLVLVEFFATEKLPKNIASIPYPTLAFAFDSTINLHLYKHILRFFDYAFVDQKSSVQILQQEGINAHWLPFCINENDFREHAQSDKHTFSFVGRITDYRTKRKNLISYIKKHYSLDIFADISFNEMQDVYAQSFMTLNENLFDGLSLRVFQALATGTVLLSEDNMDGTSDFFQDDKHLVLYNPMNLLEKINLIQSNPLKYKQIALEGQRVCKEFHTPYARVQAIFRYILGQENLPRTISEYTQNQLAQLYGKLKVKQNKRLREHNNSSYIFHELYYIYLYSCSYGGTFTHISDELEKLSHRNDSIKAYVNCLQGDISARAKHFEGAETYYLAGINTFLDINNFSKDSMSNHSKVFVALHCRLIQVSLLRNEHEQAIQRYNNLKAFVESNNILITDSAYKIDSLDESYLDEIYSELFYFIAQIYKFIDEEIMIGFNKLYEENMPNTALELGFLAWQKVKNEKVLDFFLEICEKHNVTPEYLPSLMEALVLNELSERQKEIVYYANKKYYITH